MLYAHKVVFGGKPLAFRESTFLHNPRSPSWIRHAATTIRSGSPAGCPDDQPCAQVLPGKPPKGVNQQVVVPAGLTDVTLAEVLAPLSAAKWLHIVDVPAVFGGFANPVHRDEYEAWLATAVVPFCCLPHGFDAVGTESGSIFGESSDNKKDGNSAGGGVDGDAFEAAAAANPLKGAVEIATINPGWVAIEVTARPADPSATA